ncbi:hypothetical protein RF11_02678 [Thelohanellus kitauei]|uniref:Uncharacterized protein n=1 Tax=Thelohanellus kitauei TaxID=669202 RepID=A0A0C2MUP1_THEKT|nr:hypothetical protein RF11_02678 [Thelohanellus kitauei]
MKFDIESYLLTNGPTPSSVIKKLMMDRGMSDEAARQRLSRTGTKVMRFTHFPLPKREAFMYLAKDFNTTAFWNRLLKAHSEAKTSLLRGDPVLPAGQSVWKPGASEETGGLLRREYDEILGDCLVSHVNFLEGVKETAGVRNQLLVEDILIKGVADWLRKNSFASYNKITVRNKNEMPTFCHHHWDISAPSYLRPLAVINKGDTENGFVVADVVFSEATELKIRGFIAKVNRCRNMQKTRPFLAMLVADSFDADAQKLAKNAGIMITTVKNFLGSDIAELMSNLLTTLNRAAAVAAVDPERINRLFNGLSRIEGAAINIRGAMFEMLVGHMAIKTQNVQTIDLNKKITFDGKSAEIDVIGHRAEAEIKCFECKGYEVKRLIDVSLIERWITQVQLIRRYFQNSEVYRDRKLTFAYWTSSSFTSEAEQLLQDFQDRNKRLKIEWKTGEQIIKIAREDKLTSIVTVLNDHYAKHPLSDDEFPF